uniref:C3H1-type domain-containing protein n=1 Tax=Mola mola TaxID=94237 RepID=A0A3Q4AGS7_MOLML
MDPARQKRREEIKRSLAFIHSGAQSFLDAQPASYRFFLFILEDFLTKLVCNLLEEGNTLFREGQWQQAAKEFSEGLNVSHYATANDVPIPEVLLESLYVNRAAAYHSTGRYDQGVMDCDRALEVCKESRRALYRKALCLAKLGKYREAYNCTTDCLLTSRLVRLRVYTECKRPYRINCFCGSIFFSLFFQVSTAFSVPNRTSPCTQIVPSVLPPPTPRLPPAFFSSAVSQLNSLDFFSGGSTTSVTLDALDNLSPSESGCTSNLTPVVLDSLDDLLDKACPSVGLLFCSFQYLDSLFLLSGPGIYTYVHKPDLVHNCKRDILLCRRKASQPLEWTRVRPIPKVTSFNGPYVLCRELLQSGDLGLCKYGENCTFAYNQLEIDVWTEERKGTLDRNQLFETAAVKLDSVNGIIRLLQEHKGMFLFLCQECYDHKPRIISKRRKDSHTTCSNTDARHNFDANKCLAFVMRSHGVNYSKVRPLSVLCQLDLCHKAIRLHCPREDGCTYAHSVIELKTWRVQRDTGESCFDEIVKQLTSGGGASKSKGGGEAGKSLNMKMKFACASCWRDSRISEPDKALKYCTAKLHVHIWWTKDRWLLLVKSSERSKWVQVRPLPHAKNFPLHYDICNQILEKKKCNYTGNCTFAHSQEEKDIWTYMKNNDLHDMQQIYDKWLTQRDTHNRQTEGAMHSQPAPEEKNIVMPTDFAEPLSGFYCHLCGRHSNSERQWQQHVSSEKHKDRVFSCEGEDEALTWSYRFPGKCVELCPKLDDGCSDGVSCDYAHSLDELQEWTERRDFLRQKLAKAREDMLIMPDELDFGKYNFLLKD